MLICVCVWERDREKEQESGSVRETMRTTEKDEWNKDKDREEGQREESWHLYYFKPPKAISVLANVSWPGQRHPYNPPNRAPPSLQSPRYPLAQRSMERTLCLSNWELTQCGQTCSHNRLRYWFINNLDSHFVMLEFPISFSASPEKLPPGYQPMPSGGNSQAFQMSSCIRHVYLVGI